MAQTKFVALMVYPETRDKFYETKRMVEKQLGLTDLGSTLNTPQMLEWMCNKIMSDIISKGE
jgi:hypothetical protein